MVKHKGSFIIINNETSSKICYRFYSRISVALGYIKQLTDQEYITAIKGPIGSEAT